MSTNSMTIVRLDNAYKVSAFNHWDGYPSFHGIEALRFCRYITNAETAEKFKSHLRRCVIHPECGQVTDFVNLLYEILEKENGLDIGCELDHETCVGFCEYVYLIDIDNGRFEIYGCTNKRQKTTKELAEQMDVIEAQRGFHSYYYPRYLRAMFSLDSLPSDEEFLSAFE